MKNLLFIGDAACPSGFARATHAILDTLMNHYNVTVLGINYRGDPHNYPYPIYAAAVGGDSLGVGRVPWMCEQVKPDVIVVQQDGWFIPYYIAALRKKLSNGEYAFPEHAAIPVVAAVAVDGVNFRGQWIKDVSLAVFWTQFGLNEARRGGYTGEATVIPLGVDLDTFYPVDRNEALDRKKAGTLKDRFIIGNINRNQYRKRPDLMIQYFADWIKSRKIKDATLFLQTAPTGDDTVNIVELARYHGVVNQLALCEPEIFYGQSDDDVRDTYNCFDVNITTTQGEGMGLTTLEAMACGTPCIVPDFSALGDWANGAAAMVPCRSNALQSVSSVNGSAVLGGVADESAFINALDTLYANEDHRVMLANAGRMRAMEDRFRWSNIGNAWVEALDNLLSTKHVEPTEIWQDLKVKA